MKDMYKHLNNRDQDNLNIILDMEQIAEMVCQCNYGLHRFLSAVIDIKRNSKYEDDHEMAKDLENLLNRGFY